MTALEKELQIQTDKHRGSEELNTKMVYNPEIVKYDISQELPLNRYEREEHSLDRRNNLAGEGRPDSELTSNGSRLMYNPQPVSNTYIPNSASSSRLDDQIRQHY
jgi:hypothetical protein